MSFVHACVPCAMPWFQSLRSGLPSDRCAYVSRPVLTAAALLLAVGLACREPATGPGLTPRAAYTNPGPTLTAALTIATDEPVAGQPITVDASATSGPAPITGFAWSWGDGSPSSSREVPVGQVHTYTAPGVYTISLTVTDADGSTDVITVAVTVGSSPVRGLSWTPALPAAGQPVQFSLTGGADPGSNPSVATWSFVGELSTTTGTGLANVVARYDSTGTHRAEARVQFPGAPATTVWAPIAIGPPVAPTGSIACNPATVPVNGAVACSSDGVDPVSGTLASTAWSFPGGSPATSAAANPSSQWGTAGTKSVTLTAVNSYGLSNAFSDEVTVTGALRPRQPYWFDVGTLAACGRLATGAMRCWGGHNNYELADTVIFARRSPSAVVGGLAFATITGGASMNCGLTTAGDAYCWGAGGTTGNLGLGIPYNIARMTPTPVTGGLTFTQIASGTQHVCGLVAGGQAYCWGNGANGRLGNGGTASSNIPTAVQQGAITFTSLSAGGQHTCGLDASGAAYCWGGNASGQLGTGNTTPVSVPTAVAGGLTFGSLAAAGSHTCGLTTTGAAYCWGTNSSGQLGTGATGGSQLSPVAVTGGRTYSLIAAGVTHTCALSAGEPYCWGNNANSQSGTTGGSVPTPFRAGGTDTYTALTLGSGVTCGITTGGTTACWGAGSALGTSSVVTTTNYSTPQIVDGAHAFVALGGSDNAPCGVTAAGAAWCWGTNTSGEVGDGTGGTFRGTPQIPYGDPTIASVALGTGFGCFLAPSGAASCWGFNFDGAVGDGTTTARARPTAVVGGHTFRVLDAGNNHVCGLRTDSLAYCWGRSQYGRLGIPAGPVYPTPQAVSGGLKFVAISAGFTHTCAIAADSTAYCFGLNNVGQVGDGTSGVDRSAPTAVSGGLKWIDIAASDGHSCGIATDGATYCWGAGANGRLGINGTANSLTPVAVAGGHTFTMIVAAAAFTCALDGAGAAWCWGADNQGGIGNGAPFADALAPTAVVGGHTFATLAAAGNRVCGVTVAAEVWCWGSNYLDSRDPMELLTMFDAPARAASGFTFPTP